MKTQPYDPDRFQTREAPPVREFDARAARPSPRSPLRVPRSFHSWLVRLFTVCTLAALLISAALSLLSERMSIQGTACGIAVWVMLGCVAVALIAGFLALLLDERRGK